MGKKKVKVTDAVGMFGLPSLTPPESVEMKPSALATPVPQRYNTLADEDAQRKQVEADANWGALPGKVIEDSWMVPAAMRFFDRNHYVEPEEGYKVPQEELDKLPYKMDDIDYLKKSVSPEDFKRRTTYLDEDLTRKQGMAAYGWQGAAANFVGALLDPVQWGVVAVQPEMGASRILNAGAHALSFGLQGAGTEAVLAGGDTQKTAKDVMHGFAFGSVLGGTVGALGKLHPNVALSDAADLAVRREAGLLRDADLSHTGDNLEVPTYQRNGGFKVGPEEPSAPSPLTIDSKGGFTYTTEDMHVRGSRHPGGELYIATAQKNPSSTAKGLYGKAIDDIVQGHRDAGHEVNVVTGDSSPSAVASKAKYYGDRFKVTGPEESGVLPTEVSFPQEITASDINPALSRGRTSVPGADAHYPGEAPLYTSEPATHPVFKKIVTDSASVDNAEVNRAVDQHIADLTAKGNMEFRGRQGAATRKALEVAQAQTSNDVNELRDAMNAHRAEVVAELGAAPTGLYSYTPTSDLSGKTMYHGTKADIGAVTEADPLSRADTSALFGPGLYLTDSPHVADSYALTKGVGPKGKVLSGKLGKVNLLDLDRPAPKLVIDAFSHYAEELGVSIEGKTGAELYKSLADGISEAGLTRDHAREILDDLQIKLEDAGYDGFRHEGGSRTALGKETGPHNVAILFDTGHPDKGIQSKIADVPTQALADHHTLLEFAIQKVEENYRPALARAEQKLADLTDRLRAAKESKGARQLLAEFKAKSPEEQMEHLFPDGPKFSERIARHEFVADEVGKEVEAAETKEAAAKLEGIDPMAEAGEMFDILTGEVVPFQSNKTAKAADGTTSEAVPSLAHKEAAKVKAEERAAKVQALKVRSTTGQTTTDFVKSLIERAKQKGSTTLQWLPFQWMRDRIQGVHTTLDHSQNEAFRGLNDLLHETAQGQMDQGHTASAFQHLFLNQIKSAERNRYNVGYLSWAKEQGTRTVNALLDIGGHKADFNREVYLKVVDPSREVPEGVAMAAKGHSDALDLARAIRVKSGELGWADIQADHTYMPVIFESTAVVHLTAKYGEKEVQNLISKSYQEGKYRLKANSADKLAEMQIRRSRSHQLSGEQAFKSVVSESERAGFIKDMKEAGVPEELLTDFFEEQEFAQQLDNISNRAKFSLGLNPTTEHNGMRMVDLLYTDTPMLTQNYYRESAGGAALAKVGFRSYEHAKRVVNMAEEVGLRAGANAARNKEEAEMFRSTLKLMYGKSIDSNPHGPLEMTGRRLRGVAATRALGMMGFAQFPEAARAITHLGLGTVLHNIPAVAIFRRTAARVGGTSAGELSDPVMRGIERALGYVGEDTWLAPLHIRGDEPLVKETSDQMARLLDNTLAVGGNANAIASGFQFTQGGLEKIVMRSISDKVLAMAEGKVPFPARTAGEVGWNPQFLSELQSFVSKNPKTEMFNGNAINVINFEKMPPELADTLLIGMQRLKGRIVQQNFIGDSSVWMNSSLGKVLTQFKSFSIISVEKQLIHDLRGDKIAAAQTLMWSTLLGYMAYTARTYVASIGKSDRDKYLTDHLNSRAVALGTFNMMPQVAGLSLGGDFLGTIGLLPDSMISAPGREGVHPMSGDNIAPAAGVVADTVRLAHSAIRMMDPNSAGTSADVKKAARRLVPLSHALGAGQALNFIGFQ